MIDPKPVEFLTSEDPSSHLSIYTGHITLRDLFAMASLASLAAHRSGPYAGVEEAAVARQAYRDADAMLAEREQSATD